MQYHHYGTVTMPTATKTTVVIPPQCKRKAKINQYEENTTFVGGEMSE